MGLIEKTVVPGPPEVQDDQPGTVPPVVENPTTEEPQQIDESPETNE